MGNLLIGIIFNKPLIAATAAWFLAQLIKIIVNIIKEKRVDLRLLLSIGGAVSSHCSSVSALAASIGKNFGWVNPLFAISAVFAGITISDAMGIRQEAGKQAAILNDIIEDLYQKKGIKIERLKELLGHTDREVFFGIILGIFTGVIL